MIPEVQMALGLCNIIRAFFIKFNRLLETGCTHDLTMTWGGRACGLSLSFFQLPSSHICLCRILSLDSLSIWCHSVFGGCLNNKSDTCPGLIVLPHSHHRLHQSLIVDPYWQSFMNIKRVSSCAHTYWNTIIIYPPSCHSKPLWYL